MNYTQKRLSRIEKKKKINLTAEIKAFGDYTAQIKLTHGVSCSIKVKVVEE